MIKVATPPPETSSKSPESAERSPTVQSANWKEHMLLQKKLHILNRSEKNLVHRITIDQKVMFRRFQMKLHRSKLALAEMKGNKVEVMELRGLHLHDLNTNCGQNESDYAFLGKLQYRPCTADGPSGTRWRSKPSSDHDPSEDADGVIRQVMKEQHAPAIRSMSASGRYASAKDDTRLLQSGRKLGPPTSLPLRPATAAGTQMEKEFFVLPEVKGENTGDKMHTFVANISRRTKPDGSVAAESSAKVLGGQQSRVSFANLPHNTSGIYPASTGSSRRGSTSNSEDKSLKRSQARRGSMFEEVKKLNILELFLSEARAVDHAEKVKEFCESMNTYDDTCKDFDYYPQKMQAEVEQTKKEDPLSVPGTPSIENYKFIGNTKIKSLTMPLVSFDFEEERKQLAEEESLRKAEMH